MLIVMTVNMLYVYVLGHGRVPHIHVRISYCGLDLSADGQIIVFFLALLKQ